MLNRTAQRLIAANGTLYDGDQEATGTPLPATDEQVRRDINSLLTAHDQREMPPEKPKKAKAEKPPKEPKPPKECAACKEWAAGSCGKFGGFYHNADACLHYKKRRTPRAKPKKEPPVPAV